LQALKI